MKPSSTHKSELDTPAYCVHRDVLDANIAKMASFLAERGKQWRPHAKCHKSPIVARKQIDAGAIGVTVAKVSEAEVYVDAGISDVLIANLVVGRPKLARLAELCRRADPIVCIDHYAQAEMLSAACTEADVACRVILEIDVGLERVGVRPGKDALLLAQGVAALPGVTLVGIMGYEGHLLTIADPAEKRERIEEAMNVLRINRDMLLENGLPCDVVSAGGTGSYQITADCPGVTELQAGGGVFADPFYLDVCQVTGLEPALRVIATVVSRPHLDRAIIDAGRKTIHWGIHPPVVAGTVDGRPLLETTVQSLSAEHGTLQLGPAARELAIGDKIELIPGYSDHTTVLHDRFFVLQEDRVIDQWPIAARGMLT